MERVCNINYNIALIINAKETITQRRKIYPGETWIDRVPTPPLSVFELTKSYDNTYNNGDNNDVSHNSNIRTSFN